MFFTNGYMVKKSTDGEIKQPSTSTDKNKVVDKLTAPFLASFSDKNHFDTLGIKLVCVSAYVHKKVNIKNTNEDEPKDVASAPFKPTEGNKPIHAIHNKLGQSKPINNHNTKIQTKIPIVKFASCDNESINGTFADTNNPINANILTTNFLFFIFHHFSYVVIFYG